MTADRLGCNSQLGTSKAWFVYSSTNCIAMIIRDSKYLNSGYFN